MRRSFKIESATGRGSAAGFGLLEAIVALALLAGTGMALFAWIDQNLRAATRAQEDARSANARLTALAYVETINPIDQPDGQTELTPDWTVFWQSEAIAEPRNNTVFTAEGVGPWRVSLHRLSVTVRDARTGTEVRFKQVRTGLQRTQKRDGAAP